MTKSYISQIDYIESLSEYKVRNIANEHFECKGYDCYIVTFLNKFGISLLVYKNNRQISFANMYQLHHDEAGQKLISIYKNEINRILFTDDELMDEVKSYEDYTLKCHYVINYLSECYENYSIFRDMFKFDDNDEPKKRRKGVKYTEYSSIAHAYFATNEYIVLSKKYMLHLQKEFSRLKAEPKYFREMINKEMMNHECDYTYDYTEALEALGLQEENLTDVQKNILHDEFNRICYEI